MKRPRSELHWIPLGDCRDGEEDVASSNLLPVPATPGLVMLGPPETRPIGMEINQYKLLRAELQEGK